MEPSQEELFHEFQRICRNVGLKVTTPRFAAYRFLKDNAEHPIVDRVWEAIKEELPSVSRESVYRILNDFVSHGIIGALERPGAVAQYDSNPNRHDHFFCVRCGKIFDFDVGAALEAVEERASALGRIHRVEARVQGVCYVCLKMEKQSSG